MNITKTMLFALLAVSLQGAVVVLDFEGLQTGEQVLDYYNGGAGNLGSSGPNYGINFSDSALALIDADAGGGGNFANEPTPDTILYFLSSTSVTMNVAAGFTDGFSFYYSSTAAVPVNVYSGLNATGTLLATIDLAAQGTATQGCTAGGDPTGTFACWTPVGVAFAGTAMSVDFGGAANFTGFDNITLGADVPGGAVPEPGTWLLLLSGLGAVTALRRR